MEAHTDPAFPLPPSLQLVQGSDATNSQAVATPQNARSQTCYTPLSPSQSLPGRVATTDKNAVQQPWASPSGWTCHFQQVDLPSP
eukprot:354208-Chlamydomonas_euryale.AAC.13